MGFTSAQKCVMVLFTTALFLLHLSSLGSTAGTVKFQEVMDIIEEKRQELSQHRFFTFLANSNIPARRRLQFIPYWTYFPMEATNALEYWMRIPDPQTELEHRVNIFIDEDAFHYNLFLHDVENIAGYSLDSFGTYSGVLRHLWGDDSKAVRMLVYSWAYGVKRSKDPLLTLASFEAVEAGLKDFFETVYTNLFLAEDGFPDLKYFGQIHIDLERNHTTTGRWLKENKQAQFRPLEEYDISEDLKTIVLEVINDLFYWFHQSYDTFYNICQEEDTLRPEKFVVDRHPYIHEGYPYLHEFPPQHPNRQPTSHASKAVSKEEL